MNMLREALDLRRRLADVEERVGVLGARDVPAELLASVARIEADARYLRLRPLLVGALLLRAQILTRCSVAREAIGVLEEAQRQLGARRQDDLAVAILSGLAEAHARLEEWAAVSDVCSRGIALLEQHRYDVSADYQASAYLRSRIGLYALGARAAYELEQPALAIERAELSKCRMALSHWRARRERTPEDERGRAEAAAREGEFRDLCACIGPLVDAAAQARPRDEPNADGAARKKWKALAEALERQRVRRRQLWDGICADRTVRVPPPFRVIDLQRCLGADEAVINYYWLEPGLLAIGVIAREEIDLEVRRLDAFALELITDFAECVSSGAPLNHDAVEGLSSLGPDLLPRPGAARWDIKRRLFVSPHRVLHLVPFHALQDGGSYLIQQRIIRYVPNLQSLLDEYSPPRERRLLALGIQKHRTMPELSQATLEVRHVAEAYRSSGVPALVLEDEQATSDAWRRLANAGELQRFTAVHLATHCHVVPTDAPLEVRLNLFDTSIDGLELGAMTLGAELVVTSACCSGQRALRGRGLDEVPGDDLLGLQAAFFRAGARQLVSTLWPVHCCHAYPIMRAFHEALACDIEREPDEALQGALRAHIAREVHVAYWAPFAVSAFGRRRPRENEAHEADE